MPRGEQDYGCHMAMTQEQLETWLNANPNIRIFEISWPQEPNRHKPIYPNIMNNVSINKGSLMESIAKTLDGTEDAQTVAKDIEGILTIIRSHPKEIQAFMIECLRVKNQEYLANIQREQREKYRQEMDRLDTALSILS